MGAGEGGVGHQAPIDATARVHPLQPVIHVDCAMRPTSTSFLGFQEDIWSLENISLLKYDSLTRVPARFRYVQVAADTMLRTAAKPLARSLAVRVTPRATPHSCSSTVTVCAASQTHVLRGMSWSASTLSAFRCPPPPWAAPRSHTWMLLRDMVCDVRGLTGFSVSAGADRSGHDRHAAPARLQGCRSRRRWWHRSAPVPAAEAQPQGHRALLLRCGPRHPR